MLANEDITKEDISLKQSNWVDPQGFFFADVPVGTTPVRRQKHCTNIWWLLKDLR